MLSGVNVKQSRDDQTFNNWNKNTGLSIPKSLQHASVNTQKLRKKPQHHLKYIFIHQIYHLSWRASFDVVEVDFNDTWLFYAGGSFYPKTIIGIFIISHQEWLGSYKVYRPTTAKIYIKFLELFPPQLFSGIFGNQYSTFYINKPSKTTSVGYGGTCKVVTFIK